MTDDPDEPPTTDSAGPPDPAADTPATGGPAPDADHPGEHRETKAGQQARAAKAAREVRQARRATDSAGRPGRPRPGTDGGRTRRPRPSGDPADPSAEDGDAPGRTRPRAEGDRVRHPRPETGGATRSRRSPAEETDAAGEPRPRRRRADAAGDVGLRRRATSADGAESGQAEGESPAIRSRADGDRPRRPRRADGQARGRPATGAEADRPRRPRPTTDGAEPAPGRTDGRRRAATDSAEAAPGRAVGRRRAATGAAAARRARRAQPPTRRRIFARRAGAIGTVLGLAALLVVVLFTPLVGVRSVDVAGITALTADQVRVAAQVPMGQPMLRLDTDQIAARVAKLPRVAGVDVTREWPSTVLIQVTERNPVGFLKLADGIHLVDNTGLDYATVPTAPAGLPVIQLPTAAPGDARTEAVVGVLTALPAQLRPQVVSISARTPGSVTFGLADGRTVQWGGTDDSARKAAVLGALLTQPGRTYDVSSPSLPTIRT